MAGLSDQQRRFADFVLGGESQIAAHRLAGYKGKNDNARAASASEILRNPNVASYMDERRAGAAKKAELTTAHFAQRLERMALAAERRALGKDEKTGEEVIASKDAADVARLCSMDAAKLLGLVIEKAEVTDKTVYAVSNRPKTDEEWASEYSAAPLPN